MGALSIPEPTGLRYALYIQELREFFAFSGLAYGSPGDVFAVIERIQINPSFAEDLSSLVRAAILREGGSMPHGQLLEILAIAIGGPAMEQAPQTHRTPLRQLLSFLTGVLRRPWNLPPGERAEVLSFPSEPATSPLAAAPPEAAPAPPEAPPSVATNLATALLKAATLEVAAAEVAHVEPEAVAYNPPVPPEPPQQPPAPQLEVHREPLAPMPVLATAVIPEPGPLELQQPELSEPHESPLIAPPVARPNPLPAQANLLEPSSRPEAALGLEPPPDQEAAEASPTAADQAEDRAPTFAPWVVPQRSPQPMNPQPRRMVWIYHPMREIAAVGVCALLIAGLVAVALRPGSSLSSEAQPARTPDPSPSRNSSPAPLPSPVPDPVATLPAPSVPAAADPIQSTPTQPTPAQPSSSSHPQVAASVPAAGTPPKPHTGVSDRDYIAPPTAHYYNGWGPAAARPSSPVSGSAPSAGAPASAVPASDTKSEESYGPYRPAAPVERRPGAASFVTPGDIPSAPHLFALSSSALAPNLISAPFPEYPPMARLAHVQGPVVVEALIDKDGTVTVTRVLSGHRLLRGAAVTAVQRWLYRPYRVDGHPVQVSTTLTIAVAPRLTSSY